MKSYVDYMKERGIPRGPWVTRDRDRDPEGDETRSGSVERSEIEPGARKRNRQPFLKAV